MAAFTTMALIGLAAAGGMGAGKALAKKKAGAEQAPPSTPGPSGAATTIAAPPPPPTQTATASAGAAAGMQAATKLRRKMRPATSLGLPIGQQAARGVLEPKTLTGSY